MGNINQIITELEKKHKELKNTKKEIVPLSEGIFRDNVKEFIDTIIKQSSQVYDLDERNKLRDLRDYWADYLKKEYKLEYNLALASVQVTIKEKKWWQNSIYVGTAALIGVLGLANATELGLGQKLKSENEARNKYYPFSVEKVVYEPELKAKYLKIFEIDAEKFELTNPRVLEQNDNLLILRLDGGIDHSVVYCFGVNFPENIDAVGGEYKGNNIFVADYVISKGEKVATKPVGKYWKFNIKDQKIDCPIVFTKIKETLKTGNIVAFHKEIENIKEKEKIVYYITLKENLGQEYKIELVNPENGDQLSDAVSALTLQYLARIGEDAYVNGKFIQNPKNSKFYGKLEMHLFSFGEENLQFGF